MNFSRGNLNVKTFREPFRMGAIPTPIRILPKKAKVNVSPIAKRKAPDAPIKEQKAIMIRGPIRSSMGPIGI